ncbi:MAG: aromatic amino acid lyase, partial [Rhodoluna sp.]|nr:aromatic amino acid lyase [Rhodoluna sp.]
MTKTVTLSTSGLTQGDVVDVARHGAKVVISQTALDAMAKTRAHIEKLAVAENAVYGISTGFGALANRHIDVADRVQLQKSLIRSHAAGMGAIVENEVTRALMLLRLKTLCSGRTGVRPEVAETYAKLLNANITPIVHEFGSLGCSGDLAPLAHCAMVVMGEGRAFGADGLERPVEDLLREAN